ncbi:MAG: glycosyltransferase family 4 protein [Candidatus Levybacteria bacterium]|nr:glycosyltransferase family 4 protein [Candidatus Levybacteria bacterium]
MNILILNWRDINNPDAGGAEISLFHHAKFWKRMGAKVTWFASSFQGAKEREIIDGITIIRKGSVYTVHFLFFYLYLKKYFEKQTIIVDSFHFLPFFTPLFVKNSKIIALINEVANKLWFSNLFLPFSLIGYLSESYFFHLYKNIPFITGSDSAKLDLEKCGIKSDNITVVNHGVEILSVKETVKKEKIPTILFLGRISDDKGIKDAFNTFLILLNHNKYVNLWIVGKESEKGKCLKLIHRYFPDEDSKMRIKYFGYVTEIRKFEIMKQSWVLIHPSQKEGWGLTVIEAASQSVPTVGYNVEGLKDSIKDGKTGILVKPKPEFLALAIQELINNKEKREGLGEEAKKWAKAFNWEKSSEKSWKLILKYLEEDEKN